MYCTCLFSHRALYKMAAILEKAFANTLSWRKKFRILIWILHESFPKCPVDNKSAFFNLITRRRTGDKPIHEYDYLVGDAYASLGNRKSKSVPYTYQLFILCSRKFDNEHGVDYNVTVSLHTQTGGRHCNGKTDRNISRYPSQHRAV